MTDSDCLFCRMVTHDETSHVSVYEDDDVLAIMDIRPINPGHLLVLPKVHAEDFFALDDEVYHATMAAAKRLAETLDTEFNPARVGLLVAGFDVPHVHVHLVPMHDYHDLTSQKMLDGTRGNPTRDELEAVAADLSRRFS